MCGKQGLFQNVEEVIFNIHYGEATIFTDLAEEKRVLQQIKTGNDMDTGQLKGDKYLISLCEELKNDYSKIKRRRI